MEPAVEMGKKVRPSLHCGMHGGDPSSVEFCHKIGLDYVSCSPFRVPIARLAAAQVSLFILPLQNLTRHSNKRTMKFFHLSNMTS